MKKTLFVAIVLSITLTFLGCQSVNPDIATLTDELNSIKSELQQIKDERDELKKQNDNIKSELQSLQRVEDDKKAIEQEKQEQLNEQKETRKNEVEVKFINKVNIPKDTDNWIFSNSVLFHISITNNSQKDIKGIQGYVDIQDMFGVNILTVNCDLTGNTIKSGETYVNKDMSFEINQFMDDHVKIFTTDYDDLKFIYTVKQVVYADGTVLE